MEPPSCPSDVLEALAIVRAAMLDDPPSGPNYTAEAVQNVATRRMCRLPADEDPFLIECLEQALAAVPGQSGSGDCVLQAIMDALGQRRSMGTASILGRIILDEGCRASVRITAVQILGRWDARAFQSILRSAVTRCSVASGVREWAAEALVAHGLATPGEIDAFLADPDEHVRCLTARGLAELGNADAIVRLTQRALLDEDKNAREQAWRLLTRCFGLAPARGGQC
jgi:hypothetical protein